MNGGRKKWLEEGRELTTDEAERGARAATAPATPTSRCAPSCPRRMGRREGAERSLRRRAHARTSSPARSSPRPGLPETCQRGGHIPGAANIPWGQACNEDGTFKS